MGSTSGEWWHLMGYNQPWPLGLKGNSADHWWGWVWYEFTENNETTIKGWHGINNYTYGQKIEWLYYSAGLVVL